MLVPAAAALAGCALSADPAPAAPIAGACDNVCGDAVGECGIGDDERESWCATAADEPECDTTAEDTGWLPPPTTPLTPLAP
jgi:hypothetical protein